MEFPSELFYTSSHEWVRLETDGSLTVGITDLAQDSLGELVYVDLPMTGRTVSRGESCAVVESTKAASDVYAPVDGEIIARNDALSDTPQAVNEAPYGAGWLFRIKPSASGAEKELMSSHQYQSQSGGH
jgi:glycine cleavage system H protein